jgi:hypothetical protein
MPRVIALGVILISCQKHDSHAMMLAFFPNRLDLLAWVTPNLLDGLTLYFDYAQSRYTWGSFIFLAISMAVSR